MALIPRGREETRLQVTSPVPAVQTNGDLGMKALGNVGAQIQQIGEKLLRGSRELDSAEGSSALNNAAQEAMAQAQKMAKPDGSDFQEKYDSIMGPKTAEIKSKYAGFDPVVSKKLDSYDRMLTQQMNADIGIKRIGMLETSNFTKLDKLSSEAADRLRKNPTEALANAEIKSYGAMLDEMVKTGGMSPTNAIKARTVFQERAAMQMLDGLANTKQYGKALTMLSATSEGTQTTMPPDLARDLGFIDSNEEKDLVGKGENYTVSQLTKGDRVQLSAEMSVLMSAIPTERKAALIDSMKAKLAENTVTKMADLSASVSGFEKVAIAGGKYTPANVAELKAQVNRMPNLTPQARARLMNRIDGADVVNQKMQLLKGTPRAQWGSVLESLDGALDSKNQGAAALDPRMNAGADFAMQADKMEKKAQLASMVESMRKAQEHDAAGFVLQDPDMEKLYLGTKDDNPAATSQYLTKSLAKQAYLGIPADKQRALTKGEAAANAAVMQTLPSGELQQYVEGLQQKYGSHFPRVMTEITDTNQSLKGLDTAMYAPTHVRGEILDLMKNKKTIEEAWAKMPTATAKQSLINEEIRTGVLADFNRAVIANSEGASSKQVVNEVQSLIELRVKSDLTTDPNANVTDLVNRAYNDIVASQYSVVDWDNSTILMPKNVGKTFMNETTVRLFMDKYKQVPGQKEIGVAVPKNWQGHEEQWHERVRDAGKWVTTKDQTGIQLVVPDGQGRLTTVLDKYGRAVKRDFERINLWRTE